METQVIKGGTLIDGTGKSPLKDSVIVVEGSRITSVGRVGEPSDPTSPPQTDLVKASFNGSIKSRPNFPRKRFCRKERRQSSQSTVWKRG